MELMKHNLWVVIPFYNEAEGIELTIRALANQTDKDFMLVFVDNVSTDGGAEKVHQMCAKLNLAYQIIRELKKGTGYAADAGFRYAIAHGAKFIARTDADCSPATGWIEKIKVGFENGLEFMGGRLKPRRDDIHPTLLDKIVLPTLITMGVLYGRLFYRGSQFKYPFFMAAGGNMAITASLYERAGGFAHSSIVDTNEDAELAEKVRTLTTHAGYQSEMVVYASIRRARKYGYIKTLRWFSDRNYKGEIDVR
jgi:glycosyltransferase involved in cell wall biosynthesis